METAWIVAWSRVLLTRSEAHAQGLSWWSVLALYILALAAARALQSLQLRRASWIISGLALLSSLMLLQVNLGRILPARSHPADPSTAAAVLTLLLGLWVWLRALRIPTQAGDTRSIGRHFQFGLLVIVAALLITFRSGVGMTDVVTTYFAFGLLAAAFTRIEEVAWAGTGGAAPLNRKWVLVLAATFTVAGAVTLFAAQIVTVSTVRWLLRPFVVLLNVAAYLVVLLVAELIKQVLSLLHWIFGDLSLNSLRNQLDATVQRVSPIPETEPSEVRLLSPELQQVLWLSLIALLIIAGLWVVGRAFRRWRMFQYATLGGVREAVVPEGTLAEDLAAFLRDRWRRLRAVDLRRLLRRLGTGSIRAIYASLLALLAALEHARQPEQTPYEFQPVVEQALPTRPAEIAAITEAYVRARYGEQEIGAQELAGLQEAWRRIEADGRTLLEERTRTGDS
jgi:hypothetical protein